MAWRLVLPSRYKPNINELKKCILLFYPQPASFIKKDTVILSAVHNVSTYDFQSGNKYLTPLRFLQQFIFLLIHIWRADMIVCEFAAYHSFLPALLGHLFRKPCLIIIGGNDGHNFPAMRYGNYTKGLLGAFTRWSLQLCSHIAPKHESLIASDYDYDATAPSKQGVKSVIPDLKTPYTVIENGYDSSKWYCDSPKMPLSFLTVCGGLEYSFQYQLKGIDLYVQAARNFPQATFTIVGVPTGYEIQDAPINLTLIGNTANEKLRAIYSSHQFYVQLSMAEGFPNSLCEAMLCECVPVGSAVFSIPEIIGDTGFILRKRDFTLLKPLLETAMNSDTQALGAVARRKIADSYTEEMRKDKLLALVERL